MKHIKILGLFIALLVTSVTTNAQFHLGGLAGYSSNKTATGELSLGYDFKVVDIQAGMISHVSSAVGNGTIFNVRIGHTVNINEYWSVQPAFGVAHHYRSSDNKALNTGSTMYSLYAYKTLERFPQAQLQFGVAYAQKTTIVGVGLRLNMVRDGDCGR
jgi:hypothetical protein